MKDELFQFVVQANAWVLAAALLGGLTILFVRWHVAPRGERLSTFAFVGAHLLWLGVYGLKATGHLTPDGSLNDWTLDVAIGIPIAALVYLAGELMLPGNRRWPRGGRIAFWALNLVTATLLLLQPSEVLRSPTDVIAAVVNALAMLRLGTALFIVGSTQEPGQTFRGVRWAGCVVIAYAVLQLLGFIVIEWARLGDPSHWAKTAIYLVAALMKFVLALGFLSWIEFLGRRDFAEVKRGAALAEQREQTAATNEATRRAIEGVQKAQTWPELRQSLVMGVVRILSPSSARLQVKVACETGAAEHVCAGAWEAGAGFIPDGGEADGEESTISEKYSLVLPIGQSVGYVEVRAASEPTSEALKAAEAFLESGCAAVERLEAQAQGRELEALSRIVVAHPDAFDKIAHHIGKAVSSQAVGIWKFDGHVLKPVGSVGLRPEVFGQISYDPAKDEGLTIDVFKRQCIVSTTDLGAEPTKNARTYVALAAAFRGCNGVDARLRGYVAAPVLVGNGCRLIVKAFNRQPDAGLAPVLWHAPTVKARLAVLTRALGSLLELDEQRRDAEAAKAKAQKALGDAVASRDLAEAARRRAEEERANADKEKAKAEAAAAEARAAQADLRRYQALLGHELRSPVNGMLMIARAILPHARRVSGSELMQDGLQDIVKEAHRYLEMYQNWAYTVDAILGRSEPRLRELDLKCLIQQQIARCLDDDEAGWANARIEFEANESVTVRADEVLLGQALWNVLSNAVKYGTRRPSDQVWVRVRRAECGSADSVPPSRVTVEITDCGDGIPHKERKELYKIFYRGQASRTTQQGSGIGLFVAQHAVAQCGGRLYHRNNKELKDRRYGTEGATFFMDLPIGEAMHAS